VLKYPPVCKQALARLWRERKSPSRARFQVQQATQRLADNIQDLLNCKAANKPLASDLLKYFTGLMPRVRNELTGFGLLSGLAAPMKTLAEYVEDYGDYLTKKERDPKHIKEVTGTLKRVFEKCRFLNWTDISQDVLQSFLDELRDGGRGISKRRYNGLLSITKTFCRYMVRERKAVGMPIEFLSGLENPQTDRRHERRVLEPDEIRRLLEATAAAKERFGMTGRRRALLYRFAIETGLRANELRTLTVGSFDFGKLTVTVEASNSKHRRQDILPLREKTAAELKDFFANKLPTAKAFGGTYKQLADKTSKMLRADLAEAEIPYVDDVERFFDFHALRHQTASLLAASGTSPKVAQSIMRHSDINLTMLRYTHTLRGQEAEAVENLPDLTLPSRENQRATGTDDKILSISCFGSGQQQTSVDNNGQGNLDND